MRKNIPERMFTVQDARENGISRTELSALVAAGRIERVARGLYRPSGPEGSSSPEIEILARRKTDFVVTLESALRVHDLTEATPHELWIAMRTGARAPAVDFPVRIVRVGDGAYEDGVEKHDFGGIDVRVYSAAKTVADLFKFRRLVGLELAVGALKQGLREKKFSVEALMRHAKADRVANVILPYVEGYFA